MLERDLEPVHNANVVNGAGDYTGFFNHVTNADGTVELDWWGLAKSFIALVELAGGK